MQLADISGGPGVLPIEGQWTQLEINRQVMWSFTDVSGSLQTGWALDEKTGKWYFFSQAHDGRFGHAVKGWNVIEGKSYYFSEEQNKQPFMIEMS